jgi:hypothetical protein
LLKQLITFDLDIFNSILNDILISKHLNKMSSSLLIPTTGIIPGKMEYFFSLLFFIVNSYFNYKDRKDMDEQESW